MYEYFEIVRLIMYHALYKKIGVIKAVIQLISYLTLHVLFKKQEYIS